MTRAAALVSLLLLSACTSGPSVVTKVEIEYPTVSRSLFENPPFPDYPPRPVTLSAMVQVFEEGKGLYGQCTAKAEEAWKLIQPPCEAGKTDCH